MVLNALRTEDELRNKFNDILRDLKYELEKIEFVAVANESALALTMHFLTPSGNDDNRYGNALKRKGYEANDKDFKQAVVYYKTIISFYKKAGRLVNSNENKYDDNDDDNDDDNALRAGELMIKYAKQVAERPELIRSNGHFKEIQLYAEGEV